MEKYVFPRIGDKPVSDVIHADTLAILEPIRFEKPETARRVLQRMELVFKTAAATATRTSSCASRPMRLLRPTNQFLRGRCSKNQLP
jgi:hypothetical protein